MCCFDLFSEWLVGPKQKKSVPQTQVLYHAKFCDLASVSPRKLDVFIAIHNALCKCPHNVYIVMTQVDKNKNIASNATCILHFFWFTVFSLKTRMYVSPLKVLYPFVLFNFFLICSLLCLQILGYIWYTLITNNLVVRIIIL